MLPAYEWRCYVDAGRTPAVLVEVTRAGRPVFRLRFADIRRALGCVPWRYDWGGESRPHLVTVHPMG